LFMVSNGPYAAEGWMEFLDDEDEVWLEAFETTDSGALDVSAYDEFDSVQEIVNYVAGTGVYSDRNSFGMTEEDKDMRKRQMHNDQWKIPEKMDKLADYLQEEGVEFGEIDIDPNAEKGWNVTEQKAHIDEYETKYTAHFIAYDPEEDGGEGASVYFEVSWYDEDPSGMELMELFEEKEEEEREKCF